MPDTHSLHITVSTGLHNSWSDFLALVLPRAVRLAEEELVELRHSLPLNFYEYMGVMHSDQDEDERVRKNFEKMQATVQLHSNFHGKFDSMNLS